MFQPASLKGDSPTPVDERVRTKWAFLYYLIILLSFLPCSLLEYWYVQVLWRPGSYGLFFLLLPLNAFVLIHLLQVSAILIARIFLSLVNLLHAPREGTFKRDPADKDYLFWNVRNLVKKWPLFITASNPFPWWRNRFTLRFFGVKIGPRCICDNSWISSEFVQIGKDVILGMGSCVLSFGIEQDKLILKQIVIEDGALIGAKCVLMPGSRMEKEAKLSAHSYVGHDQVLEQGLIYKGHPAEKMEET